ncbi:hypothetical protein [Pseudomonas sp. TWP3-1]|uniref:hypothetical protein n=1 Tax=Pseudomonas sp. TWP3-1 TaxID=2804631 RepID=UPI003CEAB63E
MPTTITPITPSPIPTSGPVNSLPLPTSIITTAAIAPAPHLEKYIDNGQECFRVAAPLHINTRHHDVIGFHLKSTTTNPPSSFNFGGDIVDSNFENRGILNNNGMCISAYSIDNIKNLGITSGTYKLTYSQRNATGILVVVSLSNGYVITV